MNEADILEQRRMAREAKCLVDAGLIELHQKAVAALLDEHECDHVRQQALIQIEKWDRGHLCNPGYIQAWRGILDLPVTAMRAAILRNDAEGVSLRQNSPFGFLVGRATP